jgi:hypothetical protein
LRSHDITNDDGTISVMETTTNRDGSITTLLTNEDGSSVSDTEIDGEITTTITYANGTTSTSVSSASHFEIS